MNKFLLREFQNFSASDDLLTEEERRLKENGAIILSGICQKSDVKNGNNRIYRKEILEREVRNYQKKINENRALGALDHPDNEVVSYKDASHVFTRLWMENDGSVFGTCRVLTTPQGKLLESLIHDKIGLGISSRGIGSVREENGTTIVEGDFQLLAFDFVTENSCPGAEMNVVNESQIKKYETKADRINRLLNEIVK